MTRNGSKYIAWLQILLGVLFLGLAGYRYISDGYSWENVNVATTIIFGITMPIIAMVRLLKLP